MAAEASEVWNASMGRPAPVNALLPGAGDALTFSPDSAQLHSGVRKLSLEIGFGPKPPFALHRSLSASGLPANSVHHSFAGHTVLTALVHCMDQGEVRSDIRLFFVGGSREYGYRNPPGRIYRYTAEEAFAKAKGFTRIYRTQALRRPGQYEHEIETRDAAVGVRVRPGEHEDDVLRYGEEVIQGRLVHAVPEGDSSLKTGNM